MSNKAKEKNKLEKLLPLIEKVATPTLNFLSVALPIAIRLVQKYYAFYCKLSGDALHIILGCILCFFGGLYPTLFAALEAAKHGGIDILRRGLHDLADEALVIIEANKKDDSIDDAGDGKPDVISLSNKELLLRKTKLILTKMNPEKVDNALGSMYKVWICVIATLTVKFARTVALSLTIADSLKKLIDRYITPSVTDLTPPEYKKWVPTVTGWIVKSLAMSVAWYIQTIISAFTSAVAGGLLISRTLLKISRKKGINPGNIIPESDDDTSFEETLSYVIACIGFYFQFRMGFTLPFPFNILLWPVGFVEYYIRWSVTGDV